MNIQPILKHFASFRFRKDPSEVFDAAVTWLCGMFFQPGTWDGPIKDATARFDEGQKEDLRLIMAAILKAYEPRVGDGQWCDALGDVYMELSSVYKSQAMGQYFTPSNVCDMMALITGCQGTCNRILDPTCGSGRMLLAHHAKFPGNFYFGEDLDFLCTKMALLNFCVNGVQGEVVHHNALTEPDSFRHAYRITLHRGLPIVTELKQAEESYVCRFWMQRLQEVQKTNQDNGEEGEKAAREMIRKERSVQLNIFGENYRYVSFSFLDELPPNMKQLDK
jgi:type I restriction enzyme M protein